MAECPLTVEQVLAFLPETPRRIAVVTAAVAPDRLRATPADGGWSANEVSPICARAPTCGAGASDRCWPTTWSRAAVVRGAGRPLTKTVLDYGGRLAADERSHVRQIEAVVAGLATA